MSTMTTASVRPKLLEVLSEKGGAQINPNVVMDAATYLELSGEIIRGRICTFSGADGEELCLRPDMTIPLARMVASKEIAPGQFFFSGRVFRLPEPGTNEPLEFSHTGFEHFGGESSPDADARGVATGLEALAACGVKDVEIQLGDSSLFKAFVAAFDLPAPWPARLAKAFTRQSGPADLIRNGDEQPEVSPLARALSTLSQADAAQAVEEMLNLSGIPVVGGRTPADIADRLITQSKDQAAGPLPKAVGDAVLAFMDVSGEARASIDAIAVIAKKAGVDVGAALNAFSARLDALQTAGQTALTFSSSFGRRFDYYDGLIFEIHSRKASGLRALASGGRYDGLVGRLSEGAIEATGFGLAMRPDRIAIAANEEGAQ